MSWRPGKFDYVFFFLVFLDLWAMHVYPGLRLLTKPLIVSSLLVYYVMNAGDHQQAVLLTALIFALLGDIFLMFDAPLFFQLGLGAFLVMELCYTSYFSQQKEEMNALKWGLVGGVVLVALLFNVFYHQSFGALKWPVLFYTLAISAMVVTAIRQNSSSLLFYGALLFMVSDLSLAYHKFVAAIPMSGVLVMLTYAFAQWLIVKGILDTESRRFTKA
ncbi:MAG: lysoplasmalogenase [Saprospiraceae bacterium]|nr:lysoplasmalogenase [Saprospiraceae bacterium]